MYMQSTTVMRLILLVGLAMAASGCEAVGAIFKAGVFTGVIVVVVILLLVGFLATKLRR
jgi:hypothetical protein